MQKDVRRVLQDYADACELIHETENEIQQMRDKNVVQDSVKGSMQEFPYTPTNIHISGVVCSAGDIAAIREQEQALIGQKSAAEEIKKQVDEIMLTASSRMQRIIKFRYLDRMPWEQVSIKIGGNSTGESIRKEFERFLRKR